MTNQKEYIVVFLKEELKISQQHITPFYCATDAMPYTQIIEVPMSLEVPYASPSLVLMYKHITKV